MWNASVVYRLRALGQKANREGSRGEEINTPLHGRNEELRESEGRLPPNASKERKCVTEPSKPFESIALSNIRRSRATAVTAPLPALAATTAAARVAAARHRHASLPCVAAASSRRAAAAGARPTARRVAVRCRRRAGVAALPLQLSSFLLAVRGLGPLREPPCPPLERPRAATSCCWSAFAPPTAASCRWSAVVVALRLAAVLLAWPFASPRAAVRGRLLLALSARRRCC
ncbi:hypothetical protein Scep_012562 [Stephania cephalantha]|uniref:Uncharacterized protein n=1 Tax=Stephania cephalantha TaxID=152367 RepID=A0AAP0JFC3_9MAGN